jgi:predicted small integral membrane protein
MLAVLAVAWLAMNCLLWYLAVQITVGIWFQARASERQRALVSSIAVQVNYPIFKWLCPIMAITMPLGMLKTVVSLLAT